jgi:hypothetical protein
MMDYQSQQAQEEVDQAKEYRLLISNWRAAMKDGATRKVIYDILDMCGMYADKYTGDDRTFLLLGRESIGLDILRRLAEVDSKEYPKLLLEMNDG